MLTLVPSNPTPIVGQVRAIMVAEQAIHANALGLLLSTSPLIDVVGSETFVERARAAIRSHRPDVVIISCIADHLCRFQRLFDLQLAMPDMGFVVVLANQPGDRPRHSHVDRPVDRPVDRGVIVLPAQFSVDELLASVMTIADRTSADHDREFMSMPIALPR